MTSAPARRGLAALALGAAIAQALVACGHAPSSRAPAATGPVDREAAGPAAVVVVESVPEGTPLDHPDVPDAFAVWPALLDEARATVDVAQFYVADAPGERLAPTLDALRRAAGRGVRVRLLVERAFLAKYPEPAGSLARTPGIEVRAFDALADAGGILHAKYFVVDGRAAFVGSQNFDWRALGHILEVGAVVRAPEPTRDLARVFALDWERSRRLGDDGAPAVTAVPPGAPPAAPRLPPSAPAPVRLTAGPPALAPPGVADDLTALVALLDGARHSLRVCVLEYRATWRDKVRPFATLDDALRRAAARGVHVTLAVSSWSKESPAARALAGVPNVDVVVLEVPELPGRPIPFARVVHAKFVVADDARAWIGTSNWEGDYFFASRNVALVVDDVPAARTLARVFDDARRALGRPLEPAGPAASADAGP